MQTLSPSPSPSPPLQYLNILVTSSADSGQEFNHKRHHRKCSVPDCLKRVVQGELCIGHGAKRKTCAHPGCAKNMKTKGLCSMHGPARKQHQGAVQQGGRLLKHGAKKKI
jgi:hypothetical protein